MLSRPTIRAWLGAICLGFGVFGVACSAAAQDPVATDLKQQGDAAIDAGMYEEALDAYTRALAIEPGAALHYNRGRALQALGRFAEAIAELEEFERTAPPELKAAVPRLAEMMTAVRARVAWLSIEVGAAGALVFLDGNEVSVARRAGMSIDAGDHELRVSAPGYAPHQQRLLLEQGVRRVLTVELTPLATHAILRVTSPVVGAHVSVDGRTLGTAPLELELPAGTHDVRVTHPDFVAADSSVIVAAGERRTVHLRLQQKPKVYETWWFWTGVGVVAAVGLGTAIALSTESSPSSGDIPPGRITAPLSSTPLVSF